MHAWRPSKVMSKPSISRIPLVSSAFPSSPKLTSSTSSCRLPYCRHLSTATSKTDRFIWYVALCLFRQWVFIFAILSISIDPYSIARHLKLTGYGVWNLLFNFLLLRREKKKHVWAIASNSLYLMLGHVAQPISFASGRGRCFVFYAYSPLYISRFLPRTTRYHKTS